LIKINNLTVRVKNFSIRNINIEINEGEIFAILGKTGAGKSMLLETIAGFYQPDCGAVFLSDVNVRDMEPEHRQIGFVYQDYGLFPHMSVYENIYFGLKMNKVKKEEADARIRDMVELLNIGSVIKQYPATLSGGEKQRTALARALVLNPKVLLLDEPFSALDPDTRNQMYHFIMKIHKTFSCTIVFVTHDFKEAHKLANRVGIMVKGELQMICKAEELFGENKEEEIICFLGGCYHDNEQINGKFETRALKYNESV
jgi:ABC-type sugar transport system ATPase subunit